MTGPTTATTLGSAAKALALRAHLLGLGSGEAALASSHTWTPTVSVSGAPAPLGKNHLDRLGVLDAVVAHRPLQRAAVGDEQLWPPSPP